MKHTVKRTLGLIALFVACLATTLNTAHANPNTATPKERPLMTQAQGRKRTVPLIRASSFEEAQAIARRMREQGDIGINDARLGNCGSSWMWINHIPDTRLWAQLNYGATSTKGAIAAINWKWDLYQQGFAGFYYWKTSDQGPAVGGLPSTTWDAYQPVSVSSWGEGYYKAVLSKLEATLADGSKCYGVGPEEVEYIF